MLRYPRTPFLHPPFIAPLISPGDLSLSIPSLPITVVLPRSRPRSRRPRAAALVITPATILILALVLTIFGLIIPIAPIAVVAVALTSPLLSPLSLALCSPYDGAGTSRHPGVGSRRTRPRAGSDCPLLASTGISSALTRPECVHLMPSFPHVPKESLNSLLTLARTAESDLLSTQPTPSSLGLAIPTSTR